MTERSIPDLVRPVQEATDRTLAALDAAVRQLKVRPGSPEAAMLETHREIILSLGMLSELVAQVGEVQGETSASSQRDAAIRQGVQSGVEEGVKEMVGELRRRTRLQGCILAAGMLVLGGVAMTAGFVVGREHEFRTIVADCLRDGAQSTSGSERLCAILMMPK